MTVPRFCFRKRRTNMPCLLMNSKYDLKGKTQVQHTIAPNEILHPPEKSPRDLIPLYFCFIILESLLFFIKGIQILKVMATRKVGDIKTRTIFRTFRSLVRAHNQNYRVGK